MGSLSLQSKAPATRVMKILGALVACIFAIAIPFWYYMLSVSEIRDSLTIETAFLAKSVEKAIQTRPYMWEFESLRLQEIISQPTIEGNPRERVIRTAAGTVVAKTDIVTRSPVISASAALFDSGRPVGSIEARYSIRTPVVFTVLLGILSSFLGALIYVIFRTYPIKKLDSTLADLQRVEEEQRLSRETAERLAGETAIIADIGRLIGSTLDIDEVYERFAAEARKLIPFDRLAINLYNFQENTSRVGYVSGLSISDRKQGSSVPLPGTFSEELIRTRTSLLFQPASIDEIDEIVARFPPLSATFQVGLLSLMGIPLFYRNETIGVLHFRSKKPNAYTERDLRLAERIGAQIAGAIANAQLLDNLELLAKETAIMAEIGRVISSTLDIAEVYERFAAEANKLIPFDRLTVNLNNQDQNTITVAYTFGSNVPGRRPGDSFPLQGSVNEALERTRTGMLFHLTNIDELKGQYSHLVSTFQEGIRSFMSVPLISRDKMIGVLHFRSKKPDAYKEQDLCLAERIGAQIAGAIANAQLFTERKRMEEEIREMSLRDLLTELYNRRGFITLAEQQIKAANRAQRPLQLTFIDCDRLKWINDTLGHEEGDKALIDTTHILRQTFRESDIIARLGGDEFAILSIDAADMHHEDFSRRLQQHIDAYNAKESRQYKLSLSWGTAIYNPESPISLDQLISAADELMYAQKKAKSNRRN